jgi:hypothetical protein
MKKKEQNKMQSEFLFGKRNYMIMILGLVVILIGYVLMMGGGSDEPNVFNEEMSNVRRIRLAPTVVLIGLAIEVYAIMANPDKNKK